MSENMQIKDLKLSIIGLGYVGLPLAVEFSRKRPILGFDINQRRIDELKSGNDFTLETTQEELAAAKDLSYSTNPDDLRTCNCFIVTVPTPIDEYKRPDLTPLIKASETVGKVLKKGDIVIYESTVYPGCTEDDCIPVLEEVSGLKWKEDFKVGYSPERINPGDKVHTLSTIVKVASACSPEALEEVAKTYELVVDAGVHRAASIKVAEAAKIIENTQRDVNIALINELSIIFNRVGINTYDVLEAAGTKWNFLNFKPGLVGGHCIGVDPYYLTHKARKTGYHAKVINSGRYVNDSMGFYIGKQTVKKILSQGTNIMDARVLVMGATFKENVSDIRNSKVVDVIRELESFSCNVEVVDAHASSEELMHEYGFGLVVEPIGKYDAIILAVNHEEYVKLDESYFQSFLHTGKGVFVDVKGIMKDKITNIEYWSL